ncbi:protein FAR1-RELATED SEQUENCE 5-like [Dioscorea cayenensis subsp. rotundata]|uniref:Protein FAR1-RELATED SEQUENCE n=1 Tax=Dioscorea cayennensis subsp. rotundata TaxID=55577 RepID=A0AB40AMM5_DIOCR|nr:protein FAR1-RELATED SEQUENCE 5-like [Dioscorea cayenensis subsp. rotundata]
MDPASDSDSSSGDDFIEACPDNAFVTTEEDPSCDEERADLDVDEKLNSTQDAPGEDSLSSKESEDASNADNTVVTDRLPAPKAVGNMLLEPEVGMLFHSEDEAFEFYNSYAKRKGFSVRKGHLAKRKDGSIRVRIFLCSNEGLRQTHRTHITRKPRVNERTNCKARIEFKVDRDYVWAVRKVNLEHNHPLASPSKSFMLRSHRKIWRSQLGVICEVENDEAGEDPHGAECHVKRMRDLEKQDMQVLLDYMMTRQSEDPSFFYAMQLDVNGQLTNFFWADGRSIVDYSYFGDVVSFDTTYRLSNFDIPFAPFLGVNHHKQPVLFGSALLLDESIESFIWLFKTFMTAMSCRQPNTFLTDHCDAISKAVEMAFPETRHLLCLWHIFQNSVKHLSEIYAKESNFEKDFKSCMYEAGSEEDFQTGWNSLMKKYDLEGISWVKDLFEDRERWALVYNQSSFLANMLTMEWRDSMSHLFRKYFNRKLPFSKFLEQYHKAVIRCREKESFEDFKSRQSKPLLLGNVSMLTQAAESYTRLIYEDFEEEFKNQFACLCEALGANRTTYSFKVSLPKDHSSGQVLFNPTDVMISCSCKKFECNGILCMHILKVLNNNNILTLPSQYILKRWTKYAKNGLVYSGHLPGIDSDGHEPLALHYNRICHKAIAVAIKSSASKDALELFENGLDQLMGEVDNLLHNAPNDGEQGRRKARPKGAHEKKRKRDAQDACKASDAVTIDNPSQSKGQIDDGTAGVMIDESSHVPPYNREDLTLPYINAIPMQPNGISGYASFPPETVISNQASFAPPQGIFDHTITSLHVGDPNKPRSTNSGSVGGHMPIMPGQSNNYTNWELQSFNIPNIVMSHRHLSQSVHSNVPSKQQALSHKLNLDINKGN